MSVYTPMDHETLRQFLLLYNLTVQHVKGADNGIENSTFLMRCTADGASCGRVLTIFEQLNAQQVAPYLALYRHLFQQGLPVPAPCENDQGQVLGQISDKPAVLMPWLPGDHQLRINTGHCQQIGAFLATLHAQTPPNDIGLPGERSRLARLAQYLEILPMPQRQIARKVLQAWQHLGEGDRLIHADLFRDNALWVDGQLTAVLDWYNACIDWPEYDLAITMNDWCCDAENGPDTRLQDALLTSYQLAGGKVDKPRLSLALAVAALRFWLSRLEGPVAQADSGIGGKDPAEYAAIFDWRTAPSSGVFDHGV